jgi:predicted kinase
VLVVVSGAPGSGKSTLAQALASRLRSPVVAIDPIEAAIWRGGLPRSDKTKASAYEVAAALAEQQLRLGLVVIIDAVSSAELTRTPWRRAAARAGVELKIIEVICSDDSLYRERLRHRKREIPGLPEPTWDYVVRRRSEWETWPERRLLVDSADDSARNLELAVAYLKDPSPDRMA